MPIKRIAVFLTISLFILLTFSVFIINKNFLEIGPSGIPKIQTKPVSAQEKTIQKQKIAENYGKIPISFEPNRGQTDEQVKFIANGTNYSMFLTDKETVISLRGQDDERSSSATVRMKFDGANKSPKSYGLSETKSKTNYFIGNDPDKWQTNVPNFEKVKFEKIYEGVDLVYYGNQRQLEYDFVVAPNANPDQIKLKIDGVKDANIDKKTGDLLLETEAGEVRQKKPFSYQMIDGKQKEIASLYEVQSPKSKAQNPDSKEFFVSFKLAKYDRSKELIIDPILVYGSYLGGSRSDRGEGITVDAEGNAYITGSASSSDFPTTAGTVKPQNTNPSWLDAFVTKINPTGTAIVFSTYYGGNQGSEVGKDIEVDNNGNIYFTGTTTLSTDLPVVNAYQPTFGGTDDAFLAKLNPTGSAIIYSTYLGGNNTDLSRRITLDRTTGELTVVGTTASPNFPTTPGVLKEKLCNSPTTCSGIFYSGSFVARFNTSGDIQFATLFNASIYDVTLDANNNAVIAGSGGVPSLTTPGAYQTTSSGGADAYLGKLNPAGNQIVFGTLLGGGFQLDRIMGVKLDSAGNMYVTGTTQNVGFPTTPGAFDRTHNGSTSNNHDGFLTKFNPAGSSLVYSTFLGGAGKDEPKDIALGSDNSAFVVGETTEASSFPLKNPILGSGTIFLTHFNTDASDLVYSTILGVGGGYAVALDSGDNAYITGKTTNIPVTPDSFQPVRGGGSSNSFDDAYVLKIAPTDENGTFYSISGMVTDENEGFNNNNSPVVVTVTGTINRSVNLPYTGGQYNFGNLPAGGDYTITVSKEGFEISPESEVFNNLGANQFADFTILRNREPESVITSPEDGTSYVAPATITIQATASDPDADDTIQKMEFVAYNSSVGSVPIGTDTEAPFEITWENVPTGTWSLNAYPYDNHGLRGISTPTVHVFVTEPNGPSVTLTSPTEGQIFQEGLYFPFTVDVSQTVTRVEYYADDTLIGRSLNSPFSMQLRFTETGDYAISAKAYNSQNQSTTSNVANISVVPFNHTISGIVSDSLEFNPIEGVTINLTSSNNPSISGTTTTDANGNYSFTDIFGAWDDAVTITAIHEDYNFDPADQTFLLGYSNHTNRNFRGAPITGITVEMTSPSNNQQFPANATVTLAANASSTAGTITKVEFYQYDRGQRILLATDVEAPYSFDWELAPGGLNTVYARAYDSSEAIAQSDLVNFNIAEPPDVIRLQGDVKNANGGGMQGITVRLTGTVNGQPVDQTTVSNFFGAYGFFNLQPGGDYTITPQVSGEMTFTPPFVTIKNAITNRYDIDFLSSNINQPPTIQINSPTDGDIFTMPTAIPLNITAEDSDGGIAYLTASAQGNNRFITISQVNSGTINVNWQPNEPGEYQLFATATDNGGLRTSVSLNITVNPPLPVSISGRIVDRNSIGIPLVTVTLVNISDDTVEDLSVLTDATGNYTIPNITTFNNYRLKVSKLNYTFSPQYRTYFNLATSQTTGDFTGTLQVQPSDFDGDGGSDIAVWRPSNGVWHLNRSNDGYTSIQFGNESFGDVAVPGNYDGDGKIDIAVYRNGVWYIQKSSDSEVIVAQLGTATDKPVAGDYDGDGKTDIAVWRPSTGVWYIYRSSDGQYDIRQFGLDGDIPLVGDYDGDGKTDLTVWRPSTGVWYVLNSTDGNFRASQFGREGDIPLVGDFDGDNLADYTIFRPETGVWYVNRSSDSGYTIIKWGISTDIPVPGDFDRDGKTDFGVFRKSEGNWYIYNSATNSVTIQKFGLDGDMPIPAAYNQ